MLAEGRRSLTQEARSPSRKRAELAVRQRLSRGFPAYKKRNRILALSNAVLGRSEDRCSPREIPV